MSTPVSFAINGAQAWTLRDALVNNMDGEDVQFTMQGDGTLVVGFTLTTVSIDREGFPEDN
jgi:hypothetical protein